MPPHSIEAEQGVLGGLMLDNQTWDSIADLLVVQDFFKREHRLIYQAIQTLAVANTPFDVVTIAEAMPEIEAARGLAYLSELAKNTPSVANISAYAEIVRERAHLRQLIPTPATTRVGCLCAMTGQCQGAVAAVRSQVVTFS
jgi:replicative DNA helicase